MRVLRLGLLWPLLEWSIPDSARAEASQAITWTLVAPTGHSIAGATGSVWLYCLNGSSNEVRRSFLPHLEGIIRAGSESFRTTLELAGDGEMPATLEPGGFARREYRFEIAKGIHGQVVLTTSNAAPVVLQVVSPEEDARRPLRPPGSAGNSFTTSVMGFLGEHLSAYEPIYFLLGTYPAAEFQFSLKYKLLGLHGDWNPLAHAYFAYTQSSFWDLISKDPSFYDTSYKPSGFLFYQDVNQGDAFHLDLQGGVEHESNGRGGVTERSLNTVYFQPTLRFDLPDHFEFSFQPRVWDYLSVGTYDQDLRFYRGYADLRTSLTWTNPNGGEKLQFATRLRIGNQGEHLGWLFDLRFNLPHQWHFNPAIDVQYFTGFGQTLRQYNLASGGIRAGLCLWY